MPTRQSSFVPLGNDPNFSAYRSARFNYSYGHQPGRTSIAPHGQKGASAGSGGLHGPVRSTARGAKRSAVAPRPALQTPICAPASGRHVTTVCQHASLLSPARAPLGRPVQQKSVINRAKWRTNDDLHRRLHRSPFGED